MRVVEVDDVLERPRIAGRRVGGEVGRQVGLELALEGGELAGEGGGQVDVGRVDDGRALSLEGVDRVRQDRLHLGLREVTIGVLAPDADPGAVHIIKLTSERRETSTPMSQIYAAAAVAAFQD